MAKVVAVSDFIEAGVIYKISYEVSIHRADYELPTKREIVNVLEMFGKLKSLSYSLEPPIWIKFSFGSISPRVTLGELHWYLSELGHGRGFSLLLQKIEEIQPIRFSWAGSGIFVGVVGSLFVCGLVKAIKRS